MARFGSDAALIAAVFAAAPALAQQTDLYSATVIVTGRDNLAERERGIREALPLVLSKVSADPDVADRAAAAELDDETEAMVVGYDYRDRKEGIQISDEQGTRERSFEFTVRFEKPAVDATLAKLGAAPWPEPRPAIAVALTVDDGGSSYLLGRNSEKGYGQRAAFDDESGKLGLDVRLPGDPEAADAALLEGAMTVTPKGYWAPEWRIAANGANERFTLPETTFDEAIAGALGRSAKTLAKR